MSALRYAWIGLALLLSGCGECSDDFDCPGVDVCTDAVCERARCTRDEACPPAQVCRANACVERRAVAPPQPEPVVITPGQGS